MSEIIIRAAVRMIQLALSFILLIIYLLPWVPPENIQPPSQSHLTSPSLTTKMADLKALQDSLIFCINPKQLSSSNATSKYDNKKLMQFPALNRLISSEVFQLDPSLSFLSATNVAILESSSNLDDNSVKEFTVLGSIENKARNSTRDLFHYGSCGENQLLISLNTGDLKFKMGPPELRLTLSESDRIVFVISTTAEGNTFMMTQDKTIVSDKYNLKNNPSYRIQLFKNDCGALSYNEKIFFLGWFGKSITAEEAYYLIRKNNNWNEMFK